MKRLEKLFHLRYGVWPDAIIPMNGGGSSRRYFWVCRQDLRVVGVIGTDRRENDTFIYMARALGEAGEAVPEIYGVSDDGMAYIQEPLGKTSLYDILHTPRGDEMVGKALTRLPYFQTCPQVDYDRLYPVRDMGEREIMWDLNYFKYCFLKPAGAHINEALLEEDFRRLARDAAQCRPLGLMYRDFQSRNIMIQDEPWWIDFQSARHGPLLYDLASFLWQARAKFTPEERREYAEVYFKKASELTGTTVEELRAGLPLMVLLRMLQVLGAYGLRGLTERKTEFMTSIPGALVNIRELKKDGLLDRYPELKRVIDEVSTMERFRPKENTEGLTVTVYSFSYKKGYPEDLSGNGGGFMFDCRAMHNPGRYDQYKQLTGLDKPVIDFLEERGEVQPFLEKVRGLVGPAVERYLQRGFTSLQVGFGCTGGRHRSVYCAQHLAEDIAREYPAAHVRVIHREQGIKTELK